MPLKPQSICVNTAIGIDKAFGAIVPPLYLGSNYKFPAFEQMGKYDYGRSGNPNRAALAKALSELEGGFGAVITASGMAALDLLLNLLPVGAYVIAPHDLYGGTHRLFNARARQKRINVKFMDLTRPEAAEQIKNEAPDLLLIESPSNPLMRISDITELACAAHINGALVAVDNTFMSPARQKPLELGADFSIHSTTKFINGHSDVIGGAIIARFGKHYDELAWWANTTGVTASPFDCYQTLRGLRTLFARMNRQEENAKQIARYLWSLPLVKQVYYPDSKKALAQQSGPGAVLSFELDIDTKIIRHGHFGCTDYGKINIQAFLQNTGIFQFAESLGGTESLICHPASMTHRAMNAKAQKQAGITKELLRISVGIEDIEDQIKSLEKMFENLEGRP